MSERVWVGIDPGESGAIAHLGTNRGVHPMPETEADIAELLRSIVTTYDVTMVLIEAVHAMPKNGAISSFKLGRSYGFLRGLLIAMKVRFDQVSPQAWQKAMGCLTHGDKNVSKAKAQQLFPEFRATHRTADALLIAEHCRRTTLFDAKTG